jgi:hypothetical protein
VAGGSGARGLPVTDGLEQIADDVASFEGVAQRLAGVDQVVVAPTLSSPFDVPGLFEIPDDPENRAFGDPHRFGDVPEPGIRVGGDAHQDVAVVRQEGPARDGVAASHTSDPSLGAAVRAAIGGTGSPLAVVPGVVPLVSTLRRRPFDHEPLLPLLGSPSGGVSRVEAAGLQRRMRTGCQLHHLGAACPAGEPGSRPCRGEVEDVPGPGGLGL